MRGAGGSCKLIGPGQEGWVEALSTSANCSIALQYRKTKLPRYRNTEIQKYKNIQEKKVGWSYSANWSFVDSNFSAKQNFQWSLQVSTI